MNRVFKGELRKLWEEWMSAGDHRFTKTDRMRRATYADVCGWVATAWQRVTQACIKSGFRQAEIFEFDEDLHSDDISQISLLAEVKKTLLIPAEFADLLTQILRTRTF